MQTIVNNIIVRGRNVMVKIQNVVYMLSHKISRSNVPNDYRKEKSRNRSEGKYYVRLQAVGRETDDINIVDFSFD